MNKHIEENLQKVLVGLSINGEVVVKRSDSFLHGDYSTNLAMVLFPKAKGKFNSPIEFANAVKQEYEKLNDPVVERVEVIAPGFLNFFVSLSYLYSNIDKFLDFEFPFKKGKKILVEFTDPNPFKEFHIGHLYSNIVGESLSRLLENSGAKVTRVCYQGDVGMHVAKAIYGMLKENKKIEQAERLSNKEKVEILGQCYAYGARFFEEDSEVAKEIKMINEKIYKRSDETINRLYDLGKKWSLEYFSDIYERLGTHFSKFYFESEAGPRGVELVEKNLGKVFEKDNEAVIFKGDKYGLHRRVFINSQGLPTYEAKELGLAFWKYEDFLYDESIIVTGNEINEYFKVLLKALELLDSTLAFRTKHISHGMVRLSSGKMSSRTGNVITGEGLLDEVKRSIKESYPELESEVLEKVTIGAIKYALLKSSIGKDIVFNIDESISLEGNSGPYLQYTYARTQSVLEKAGEINSKNRSIPSIKKEEEELLRVISLYPYVLSDACYSLSPSTICTYLFEVCQKFNLFYQKHKILDSESREFRLVLTKAVGQILKNALSILGIQAPSKM